MSDTCENCRYFKASKCFRYPPILVLDKHNVYSGIHASEVIPRYISDHPDVLFEGFCGEFRITEEVEAERRQRSAEIRGAIWDGLYGFPIISKEEQAGRDRSAKLEARVALAEAGYIEENQDGKANDKD